MVVNHPDEFRRSRRVLLTPQKRQGSRLVWLVGGIVPVVALIAVAAFQFDLGVGPARAEAHAASPADDQKLGSDHPAIQAPLDSKTDEQKTETESIHP
ncbi:MAG: hypothetical protein AAF911_01695 [Planctomycetota bacterium]